MLRVLCVVVLYYLLIVLKYGTSNGKLMVLGTPVCKHIRIGLYKCLLWKVLSPKVGNINRALDKRGI